MKTIWILSVPSLKFPMSFIINKNVKKRETNYKTNSNKNVKVKTQNTYVLL